MSVEVHSSSFQVSCGWIRDDIQGLLVGNEEVSVLTRGTVAQMGKTEAATYLEKQHI